MFKKVYVEITNCCNLNCSFCIGTSRKKEFLSLENFDIVLRRLENYTSYLYLHVLGEPLLHPQIGEIVDAASKKFKVNITTNGYLIDKIKHNTNIRQVNVSLHSFLLENGKTLDEYMNNIFEGASLLSSFGTIVNYRIWVDAVDKYLIIHKLEEFYGVSLQGKKKCKLAPMIFFEVEKSFEWPSVEKSVKSEIGTCRALKDHIAILVNGDVVPCCLDSAGAIVLGNIYKQNLDDIIGSDLFQKMKKGFLENKKVCLLCQTCDFYDSRRVI